ncbi:purine-nucleoside phosphorylase, partial [Mycoplasmopsis meleagridis]|uniref:purine-nucleoside phosphorylase n=1 Tax=Mycoplasmopsis meleagridis TaxID=29561 RepID=UPI0009E662A3
EIAKTVIMPGDPLRAKFIAENYLDPGYKLVSDVRNIYIYTGTYKGKNISIAASGMGIPSMGIYSYELFKFYDVDRIIRTGSTGAYKAELSMFELILGTEAIADSDVFRRLVLGKSGLIAYPSNKLNDEIRAIAKEKNIKLHEGRIHTSDVFYSCLPLEETIQKTGAICIDNESYALFNNAEALGKEAASILTVSDNLITHEIISADQRQNAFTKVMEIALNLAK